MDKFEFPRKAVWDEESYNRFYGRLTVEPLERGYATTLGNSLRRVLLSSITGTAVTAVRIDGVDHEFTSVEGVKEDVTDIILNLKRVYLKPNVTALPDDPFRVDLSGRGEVLSADLFPGPELTVLNPNLHIASLVPGSRFALELTVRTGFGYVPVSRMETEGNPIGTIPVAATFSPVTKVAYQSENTRVGQRVDYERLIIEVWTNGAVSPREAVGAATEILGKHFTVLVAGGAEADAPAELPEPGAGPGSLEELGLSTRVVNILKAGGVTAPDELCGHTGAELKGIKNLGEKAYEEIIESLKKYNLSLKGD